MAFTDGSANVGLIVVRGQPAVAYNQGVSEHWPNLGSWETQYSWVGNPGAYGGCVGEKAIEAAVNQQMWAGPEARPL